MDNMGRMQQNDYPLPIPANPPHPHPLKKEERKEKNRQTNFTECVISAEFHQLQFLLPTTPLPPVKCGQTTVPLTDKWFKKKCFSSDDNGWNYVYLVLKWSKRQQEVVWSQTWEGLVPASLFQLKKLYRLIPSCGCDFSMEAVRMLLLDVGSDIFTLLIIGQCLAYCIQTCLPTMHTSLPVSAYGVCDGLIPFLWLWISWCFFPIDNTLLFMQLFICQCVWKSMLLWPDGWKGHWWLFSPSLFSTLWLHSPFLSVPLSSLPSLQLSLSPMVFLCVSVPSPLPLSTAGLQMLTIVLSLPWVVLVKVCKRNMLKEVCI